ncbi:MAG: Fic family protein [Cytophagaceae bacterium]|nr:Fic family protein [Cytophagaceae bacterium]
MKKELQTLLNEIEELKTKLDQYRYLESNKVAKAFELEYTYESNRIEGNTLTLQETALVVEKGLTISGKSLQEHMEAINHTHGIEYVKELVREKTPLTETIIRDIHRLILQSIDNTNAGYYRTVQVLISGATFVPPQPLLVPGQIESFFSWYQAEKNNLHPVILSAEMHERLVTIHPFIDGNGRTSRLLMNLILLQNGYPIAILKGDADSRLQYYKALETAQTEHNKEPFFELIATNVKATLNKVLQTLGH